MSAAEVAEVLAGNRRVKKQGNGYLVHCPAHEDASPSLSLADGDRGLMVHCFAGCDPADIYAAIRRMNGQLLKPSESAPRPATGTAEYARRQREKAQWLWRISRPASGTIVEAYLKARGLTMPPPATVRFLKPLKPEHHPAAIVAYGFASDAITETKIAAAHLILLKADGSGKANVPKPKLTIGSPSGAPLMLAPMNDLLGLAICEGVEDALTVHEATGLGAWAAGGASFLPKLADAIERVRPDCVTIYAHADAAGRDGARKLAELLRRHFEVIIEGLDQCPT
jgi:putative DNA primase/helicase